MGFMHSMVAETTGIRPTAPVKWRAYDALCAVYWQAEGRQDATGYYRSSDPRVMLFLEDVSNHIGASQSGAVDDPSVMPLARVVYVPSGVPLWTRFGAELRFSHLDLHMKEAWLAKRIERELGADFSSELLLQGWQAQDAPEILAIGEALRHEICTDGHHPAVAECLAVALVVAIVGPRAEAQPITAQSGGLTPSQMRRLRTRLNQDPARRLQNAELAEAVGLSPSWFAHALKRTTGKTPQQWQQERRIDMAKRRLLSGCVSIAETAGEFGFSDQAHFTRIFRQVTRTTPAVWLRENLGKIEESSRLCDGAPSPIKALQITNSSSD